MSKRQRSAVGRSFLESEVSERRLQTSERVVEDRRLHERIEAESNEVAGDADVANAVDVEQQLQQSSISRKEAKALSSSVLSPQPRGGSPPYFEADTLGAAPSAPAAVLCFAM